MDSSKDGLRRYMKRHQRGIGEVNPVGESAHRSGFGAILLIAALVWTGYGSRASTVNVIEKEWTIEFANPTIKAGLVKLVVKNVGAEAHNLVIQGTSLEVAALNIWPGKSKEVTFELKPGTYSVLCSLPGHESKGMTTTLTVSQ
jgi:plastocyanin